MQTPDALTELALERLDDEGLGQARTLLPLLALLPDSPVSHRLLLNPGLADSELFPRLTGPHLEALLDGLAALALVDLTAGTLTMDPAAREFAGQDNRESGQLPAHAALLTTLVVAVAPAAELAGTAVRLLRSAESSEVDLPANACLLIGEALAEHGRHGETQGSARPRWPKRAGCSVLPTPAPSTA